MVLHINLNLFLRLVVSNTEAAPDLDFGTVITAHTQKSSDNALLVQVTAERVVEDGEEGLGLDNDVERLGALLLGRGERAGEVEVGIGIGHYIGMGGRNSVGERVRGRFGRG